MGSLTSGRSSRGVFEKQVLGLDGLPAATCSAATVPSRSAWRAVSIFIASMVISRSPATTERPLATATEATTPGIGAETWHGLAGSAFGRRTTLADASRFSTLTVRGWPFSSKKTRTAPSSSVSPTARQRMTSVCPRSISTEMSRLGASP